MFWLLFLIFVGLLYGSSLTKSEIVCFERNRKAFLMSNEQVINLLHDSRTSGFKRGISEENLHFPNFVRKYWNRTSPTIIRHGNFILVSLMSAIRHNPLSLMLKILSQKKRLGITNHFTTRRKETKKPQTSQSLARKRTN